MRLRDYKVLSFDCYGTLIDWESGLLAALTPLTARIAPAPTPDAILAAFAALEGLQQRATPAKPYREILAIVFRRLAERHGIAVDWAECLAFGASVAAWPAFADSAAALASLKRRFKLVVLSNVDNLSFEGSRARLGIAFDAIVTAEETGAYKPDRRGFDYMIARLDEMGHPQGDILHVAQSLHHDHGVAIGLGLTTCFIDRRHGRAGAGATPVPATMPEPRYRFESMAAFAAACDADETAD